LRAEITLKSKGPSAASRSVYPNVLKTHIVTDLAQEIFQKTWSWFESDSKRRIEDADRHNHKGSQTLKEAIGDLPESLMC